MVVAPLNSKDNRRVWRNKFQHLIFFLGYIVNFISLSKLIYGNAEQRAVAPSIFQLLVVSAFIGGPLVFIQSFIGQFTQRGCISVGAMLPAMYGFGFCMLVISFYNCVISLYYISASFGYAMESLLNWPEVPWMFCSDKMMEAEPNCFDKQDIYICIPSGGKNEYCYRPDVTVLSTEVYRYLVAFEQDPNVEDVMEIQAPSTKPLMQNLSVMLVVYLMTTRGLKNMDWTLRFCLVLMLFTLAITLVPILGYYKSFQPFINIVKYNVDVMFRFDAWVAAYRRVTEYLRLSSGGHVLLGSYMTSDTPTHFRVVYLMSFTLLYTLVYCGHYFLAEWLLKCTLGTKELGLSSAYSISFVVYPTQFGISATPQLWCTIYYITYLLHGVSSLVLEVTLITETICVEYNISVYYHYLCAFTCFLIYIAAIPLTTNISMLMVGILSHELEILNLFIIMMMFLIICLYGIQRINDDVQFLLNVTPTWYIQTCWILTALVTAILLAYDTLLSAKGYVLNLATAPILLSIGLPLIAGFAYKTIRYFKKKNITGIFRASSEYGDPSRAMRLYRVLYNPRFEVRYRRKKETCKHHCLLNNEIIVKAVERELILMRQIIMDLQQSENFRRQYISVTLQEHLEVFVEQYEIMVNKLEQAKLSVVIK